MMMMIKSLVIGVTRAPVVERGREENFSTLSRKVIRVSVNMIQSEIKQGDGLADKQASVLEKFKKDFLRWSERGREAHRHSEIRDFKYNDWRGFKYNTCKAKHLTVYIVLSVFVKGHTAKFCPKSRKTSNSHWEWGQPCDSSKPSQVSYQRTMQVFIRKV